MIQNEKFVQVKKKPLILFSPLDWGLGHTTRCIPLIRECVLQGCEVVIACNSIQKALLEQEFPALSYVFLPGYDIRYASGPMLTRLKLLFQLPNILTKIKREHSWINEFFSKNTVSAVVSDNRYGLSNPAVPCVFLTHQLSARTGSGKIFDKIVQFVLYRWISRFNECWVPDYKNEPSLSGELSHPKKLPPVPVKYIGPLSRFNRQASSNTVHDVMILLSGPEPQRTLLENIVLNQLQHTDLKVVLIRGLPIQHASLHHSSVQVINHASAEELNQLICQSAFIIARSGYTTIMDLLKLQKKMILIPTPGQPEQEYLARWLSENKMALSVNQDIFSLPSALDRAANFEFSFMNKAMDAYKPVVQHFAASLG